tara:strand:+ start:24370 stop:24834 length:465 start_codon:yes stop_codon:yes gene_type:complete
MFRIVNTKRSNEKGQEYLLSSKHIIPTTFFKYLDHLIINVIEMDLNNKKNIKIFVKQGVSEEEAVNRVSDMMLIFMDNHYIQNDPISGPYFIEKVKEEVYPMPNVNRKKSKSEIKEEISNLETRMNNAVSRENYEEAAKLRDQIEKLNGKETSI